jgi:hypothetical protein
MAQFREIGASGDAIQKDLRMIVEEETLDPDDWTDLRALSDRIVDDAVAYLGEVRDRPAWRHTPADIKAFFLALATLTRAASRGLSRGREERHVLSNGQRPPALPATWDRAISPGHWGSF